MKLKSYAKVNLSLNIVGKFRSKKHKIESLGSFLDFYDLIYLKPTSTSVSISSMYTAAMYYYNHITL